RGTLTPPDMSAPGFLPETSITTSPISMCRSIPNPILRRCRACQCSVIGICAISWRPLRRLIRSLRPRINRPRPTLSCGSRSTARSRSSAEAIRDVAVAWSRSVRRSDFITLLGGAAAAWPLTARAQQADRRHRIAIISPSAPVTEMIEAGDHPAYQALFNELGKLGYVEGRNLIVERYSAEGRPERSTDLAHMVVRTQPDLILTVGNWLVRSLKAATNTIPIVASVADPVAYGLVANLAHPD